MIINCPNCNNEISDKSTICVHCGFSICNVKNENENPNIVNLFGQKIDLTDILYLIKQNQKLEAAELLRELTCNAMGVEASKQYIEKLSNKSAKKGMQNTFVSTSDGGEFLKFPAKVNARGIFLGIALIFMLSGIITFFALGLELDELYFIPVPICTIAFFFIMYIVVKAPHKHREMAWAALTDIEKEKIILEKEQKIQMIIATNTIVKTNIIGQDTRTKGDFVGGVVGGALFGVAGAIVGSMGGENEQSMIFHITYKDGHTETKAVRINTSEFKRYMMHLEK